MLSSSFQMKFFSNSSCLWNTIRHSVPQKSPDQLCDILRRLDHDDGLGKHLRQICLQQGRVLLHFQPLFLKKKKTTQGLQISLDVVQIYLTDAVLV